MKVTIPSRFQERVLYASYALAVTVAVSVWFIALRAPLWLDETISFALVSDGLSKIFTRTWPAFPGYEYILWLATKILGTSEIALRIPSILAMLGAAYLLYLAARELFERDVAIIAAVVFCVHPIVIFESIDARPYAFAVLATNAAILVLFRLRHNNSNALAALFGLLAAMILWFHYLFAVILPALAIGFFLVKKGNRAALWRQAGIALTAFALASLPVIPGLENLFYTRGTHVVFKAPTVVDLIWTLSLGWMAALLGVAALAAIRFASGSASQCDPNGRYRGRRVLLCALLALVPILILYGVSVGTPIHVFYLRYRLVAIPGIALCWALAANAFNSRAIRLLFCLALVLATAYQYYSSPNSRFHSSTWKYALEAAEKTASKDNAPVLICSDLPESNFTAMPLRTAKKSVLFAPLSYYKLSVPVVPLPRALNHEARQVASDFLQKAKLRHERFLALAYRPSYKTLDWLADTTAGSYNFRQLGNFEGVKVLEFTPSVGQGTFSKAAPSPKRSCSPGAG